MNHDEEMLSIERERLEMEKRRDRHASHRFFIGTVLLAAGTTGASLYINNEQEKRSLIHSERQWVVPIMISLKDSPYEERINKIDSLLKIELTGPTTNYLKRERLAAAEEMKEYRKRKQAEIAARKEAEQAQLASISAARQVETARKEEKEKAQRLRAEKEAKIAKATALAASRKAAEAEKERKTFLARQLDERIRRIGAF